MEKQVSQAIKERIQLEHYAQKYVSLKFRGKSWTGLCPFHREKNPSFHIFPQTQTFKCFSCGASGDVFSFVEKIEGITFVDALKKLSFDAGIELQLKNSSLDFLRPLFATMEQVKEIYCHALKQNQRDKKIRFFLDQRKISAQAVAKFQLGYALENSQTLANKLTQLNKEHLLTLGLIKKNTTGSLYDFFRDRILFPITNQQGKVIAFGARTLSNHPAKYLNSSDSPLYHKNQTLYGWFLALPFVRKKRRVILVEGYMDVLRMHTQGFQETLAFCGTALHEQQVEQIKKLQVPVYLLLDSDPAGLNAANKAGLMFLKAGVKNNIILLPNGQDPDAFLLKHDPSSMEELITNAPFFENYYIDKCLANQQNADSVTKAEQVKEMMAELQQIPNVAQRKFLLEKVAHRLQISLTALTQIDGQKTQQNLKQPTSIQLLPNKAKWTWQKEKQNIEKHHQREKTICSILLMAPQYFSTYKNWLPTEVFENSTLQAVMAQLLSYDSETSFLAAYEQGFDKMHPEYEQAILWLSSGPLTQKKKYQEASDAYIKKRIYQLLNDHYAKRYLAEQGSSLQNQQNFEIFKKIQSQLKKQLLEKEADEQISPNQKKTHE